MPASYGGALHRGLGSDLVRRGGGGNAGAPKLVTFPYRLSGGRLAPIISAGVRIGQAWRPIQLYLDSGATYTILRARVAQDVQFDYETGRKVLVQVGDGTLIPVFLHQLPMQIGSRRFVAPVGFSAKLGVPFNLLGRLGVFEHFRICFIEKRRTVTFLPLV